MYCNAGGFTRLTQVGPGTPMGEYLRRYWIPAGFSYQTEKPDAPDTSVPASSLRYSAPTRLTLSISRNARWPTIAALASANDADILGEWAGLGYYARARNLHACARAVASSST